MLEIKEHREQTNTDTLLMLAAFVHQTGEIKVFLT